VLKITTHKGQELRLEGDMLNGKKIQADIVAAGNSGFHVIKEGKSYRVNVIKTDRSTKTIAVRINRKKYILSVKDKYDEVLEKLGMGNNSKNLKDLKAPMPGKVLEILVNGGQEVKKEQALIVLEAMKMENVIKSPGDGTIKAISVQKGNTVEKNQVLINFE